MVRVPQAAADSSAAEAKRIILAIIQENGGSLEGRTRLYKAFYYAHLWYWREHGKYLTAHPIVHMPNGPGIDRGDTLLGELVSEQVIRIGKRPVGPYVEDVLVLSATNHAVELTTQEREAITRALALVNNMNARELSDHSHEQSRTWREANERGDFGAELMYVLDALTDAEFDREQRIASEVRAEFQRSVGTNP